MKRNTNLNFALMAFAVVVCLMSFVFEANGQKRRRPARKPVAAAKTTTPPASSAEIKEGSQKVATQIKNVSKFVYLLGGIAKNIEALDADIRARRTTRQAAIDDNQRAKQAVVQSIRNLQAGLGALETDFRTKNSLRIYSPWIDGVSSLTANAAEQASAGQLTESGNTLLMVIEKLSDALAALP